MRLPDIGELNRRVKIIRVDHEPTDDYEKSDTETVIAERWCKVEIVGGSSYWDSVNTDETITHRIYIRYAQGFRPQDIPHSAELEVESVRYRVRRCTDCNFEHRFTMFEAEELGYGAGV